MAGISGEQRLRTQLYLQSSRVARDSKVVKSQAILNLKIVQPDDFNCWKMTLCKSDKFTITRSIVLFLLDFSHANSNYRRFQEKCKNEVPHHMQNDTEDLNNVNDSDYADNWNQNIKMKLWQSWKGNF